MSHRSNPAGGEAAAGQSARGTVSVEGVRIVYESRGTGPALVCCHGFGVNRIMWQLQIEAFARAHRVITFDQRGHGESDHPLPARGGADPYTLDAFAEDLRGVLDDLGIHRARILGQSMGGATALRFAMRWPARVEALILASTMASRLPEATIERAREVERVLGREGVQAAVRFYFQGPLLSGVARESQFEAFVEILAATATPHGFLGGYRVAVDRPSMMGDLDRVRAPTLILVGERDSHYLGDAGAMVRRIPGARKVIMKGLGHSLSAEAPEAFADEVVRFLKSLPRNSSK
jgi:pimeloyl-ACP methyl ester carboxylesterase